MKTKIKDVLPKIILGSVNRQFKKCGKSNCKCARGDLHGPYFYHFFRVGGNLKKRYLKASKVEQTRLACLARQEIEKEQRVYRRRESQLIREIREVIRELETISNNYRSQIQ